MKPKKTKKPVLPEIYAVKKEKNSILLSRKEFLGTIGTLGAGLALAPTELFADKIMDDGALASIFKAHSNSICSICFSSDGKMLATSGRDETIKLWSIPDGRIINKVDGAANSSICFSCDNQTLFTGNSNKTIKQWSVIDGTLAETLNYHNFEITAMVCGNDERYIISGDKKTLCFYSKDKVLKKIPVSWGIQSLAISSDKKILAVGSYYDVKIVSTVDLKKIRKIKTSLPIKALALSPDGKLVAIVQENMIKIYSVYSKTISIIHCESYTGINCLSFSPDGKIIASGSSENKILLWSVSEKSLLKTLDGHDNYINSIVFSNDGTSLVSGDNHGVVRLWTMPDATPVFVLFDPAIIEETNARKVRQMGPEIITLPCGTPIPEGSYCICDCIASSRSYPGSGTICTCDTIMVPAGTALNAGWICICDTISVGTYTAPATYYSPSYKSNTYYYTTYSTYWYPN
jgi:WD40 repeat protein